MGQIRGRKLTSLAMLGALLWSSTAGAQSNDELRWLEMEWLEVAKGCLALVDAKSKEPLVNPNSGEAYGLGRWGECPETVSGATKLVLFDRAELRDLGVRFYASWGRIYVFRFFPDVEGWGHGQKFRFEWVPPEKG